MMAAWVAFAREGDPNSALDWPEYGETGELLVLGDEIETGLPWQADLCPHLEVMGDTAH